MASSKVSCATTSGRMAIRVALAIGFRDAGARHHGPARQRAGREDAGVDGQFHVGPLRQRGIMASIRASAPPISSRSTRRPRGRGLRHLGRTVPAQLRKLPRQPAGRHEVRRPSSPYAYTANARAAVAEIFTVTQSPDAMEAFGYLTKEMVKARGAEGFYSDPTWNIAPKLAVGDTLDIRIRCASSAPRTARPFPAPAGTS